MPVGSAPRTDPSAPGPTAILIGPMGAGKTHVGAALADLLGLDFLDLDQAIEARVGRTVPEIFTAEGEAGFRAYETAALQDLLATHTGVLALGGGAPLTPANRDLLLGRPVVLLEIGIETARERLAGGVGRPLLSGDDPLDRWQSIQEQRLPVYRDLARCRVDAASGTPADVARTIHDQLTSEETA